MILTIAIWVCLVSLVVVIIGLTNRLADLHDTSEYLMRRVNDLEEFRGGAEMYIAGRLTLAETPDRTPGMP